MARWSKKTLRLPEDHGWEAKPGYQIFVADRGAVRFDIPKDWHVSPEPGSVKMYDQAPPEDNWRLEVSFIHLPKDVDFGGLPVATMLAEVMKDDDPTMISRTEITKLKHRGIDIAWLETKFTDPNEHREAFTRTCVARGRHVQTLITLDYWPEHADRVRPVWDEVLRSLRLGEYIKDPLRPRPRPTMH